MFNKKFDESVRRLEKHDFGEMLTHEHPEPQPIERHNFWFLWKEDFEEYFEHIEGDTHRNSVFLQQEWYEKIDEIIKVNFY